MPPSPIRAYGQQGLLNPAGARAMATAMATAMAIGMASGERPRSDELLLYGGLKWQEVEDDVA